MNSADLLELLTANVTVLSLALLRITVAFMLLPVFNREGLPPLVRNTMYFSLALVCLFVQPSLDLGNIGAGQLLSLYIKEALVGVVIGVFFGLFLWAFEAAGIIIDMQVGASFALYFDPIVGNEATLFGSFLSRWAGFLFLASGGMLMLTGAVLESFVLVPLTDPIDSIRTVSVRLFEAEYARFISLSVRIAGPIMVVIFIIDITLGLVNRYAQQFNVFFLSMSLKSIASVMMLWLLLPFLVTVLVEELSLASASWAQHLSDIIGN